MIAKNAGGKNEDMSHDIIENTCRKNVSLMPCHDVDENKVVNRISGREKRKIDLDG
jgi:hypothetical protein